MKKKNSVWLIVGVIIAIVLLMYWLFAGTTLEEEASQEISPVTIEQNS